MNNEIMIDVDAGVMVVTINRPDARNSINLAVAEGLSAAMDRLDGDSSIRVAILSGAGNTFCSGMDLKAFLRNEIPVIDGRGFAGIVESFPRKPVIAAVEGYALAGGFEIAIGCDLVVASEEAKFGIPEVKRGLIASSGGVSRLPRQIPTKVAMEMALTGDFISAQRAYELGLVNRITAPGRALSAAQELAQTISKNAPLAVAVSKKIVIDSHNWSDAEMFDKQRSTANAVAHSEDAKEGAAAFAEKREPIWNAR
jgi:enoyl-CoA hydratase